MASLWAYRREDWPGMWLWRPFNALFWCCRMPPTCDLGPIGPRKGWAEEAQGAPSRAPRGAVREGGARGARNGELVALAAFNLGKPVRSVFSAQRFVRLVATRGGADWCERELGREDLALAGGEEAGEAGVEGGAHGHQLSCHACMWDRRRDNEAVLLSVLVSIPEPHPVVPDPLLHSHDHGLVVHQQSPTVAEHSLLEFPTVLYGPPTECTPVTDGKIDPFQSLTFSVPARTQPGSTIFIC